MALSEARRDPGALPPVTWSDIEMAEGAMKRVGLHAELTELQEETRVPPSLPMYEFYRWGYDEWHPTEEGLRAFVAACRRLVDEQ
jgi:hypothetical protein